MGALLALIVGLVIGAGGFYVALQQHLLPPDAVPVAAVPPPPAPPPPVRTIWHGANELMQLTTQAAAQPNHTQTFTFNVTPNDPTVPNCPDPGDEFQPAPGETVSKTDWGGGSYFSVKNKSGHHLVFKTPTECDNSTQ